MHNNKGSELQLWIFENINLSQFFDLKPLFLRNRINSSLWANKAVQSALKLSNEQFKTHKNDVNNRMIYFINCFWPHMPEMRWCVGLSWIFYPQFGLATICGYLLFPAGYLLVSDGHRCWHEDSFREVVEMLHDETKTDLLSQFQACKLVWSIVQKKFFLWWTCHGVVQQDGVGDENPQQCVCFPSEWVGVCLRKYGLIGKSRQKIFRDRPSSAFTHWGNLDIS